MTFKMLNYFQSIFNINFQHRTKTKLTNNYNKINNINNNRDGQTKVNRKSEIEDEDNFEYRHAILNRYLCPLLNTNDYGQCSDTNCPFGHQETERIVIITTCDSKNQEGNNDNNGSRRDRIHLPYYICVHHLMDQCRQRVTIQTRLNVVKETVVTYPPRCANGYHLSLEHLIDLDTFERENSQLITDYFRPLDLEHECAICREVVSLKRLARERKFGLLEQCDHCFCAGCISAWRRECRLQNSFLTQSYTYSPPPSTSSRMLKDFYHFSCPVCRKQSISIRFVNHFITDPTVKGRIFRKLCWSDFSDWRRMGGNMFVVMMMAIPAVSYFLATIIIL